MTCRTGALCCAVLALLAAGMGPWTHGDFSLIVRAQQPLPVFRSRTVVVQIDAFVTDAAGNPVEGLTAEDFEVLEAGWRRPISSFAEVRLSMPVPRDLPTDETIEPDVATNLRPPGRTFVFAFDEIGPDRALRMRHVLREFLEQHFGPDDQAAMALLGRGLADSGQDFTSNRRLLIQALDKVSGGGFGSTVSPADALTLTETRFARPAPQCPQFSDVRQLAASLRRLSEFLATLPGRKVLVLVAEGLNGLDFDLLRVYRGGVLSLQGADALAALSALTRGNVTVYPLDPCGLQIGEGAERLESQADLNGLAEVTGGFAVTNTNNFTGAFDRLLSENSRYYTIGFTSAYDKLDGRFVPVTVRVKRPGLQVRSRAGYLAPKDEERRPDPVKGDTRLATIAAGLASAVSTPGVGLHVAATPYRSERGATHVSVVVEMEVPGQGLTRKGEMMTAPIEVSYLATDSRGKVKPGKRHAMTLTLPAGSVTAAPEPLGVWSDFQLAPGRYQLRVAGGTRATAGSAIADLEVPDFSKRALAMSGVFLTAESATTKAFAVASPLAAVLPATPTTRREFSRAETVMGYVEVYENAADRAAPETIDVSASLRAESGRTVPLTAEIRAVSIGASSIAHRSTVRIPLAEVPAGDYVFEVLARSRRQDQAPVIRRIPLRVR